MEHANTSECDKPPDHEAGMLGKMERGGQAPFSTTIFHLCSSFLPSFGRSKQGAGKGCRGTWRAKGHFSPSEPLQTRNLPVPQNLAKLCQLRISSYMLLVTWRRPHNAGYVE